MKSCWVREKRVQKGPLAHSFIPFVTVGTFSVIHSLMWWGNESALFHREECSRCPVFVDSLSASIWIRPWTKYKTEPYFPPPQWLLLGSWAGCSSLRAKEGTWNKKMTGGTPPSHTHTHTHTSLGLLIVYFLCNLFQGRAKNELAWHLPIQTFFVLQDHRYRRGHGSINITSKTTYYSQRTHLSLSQN